MAKDKKTQVPTQGGPPQPALTISQQIISGPLPSPDTLAQYDKIAPGAAERIIAMALKQSSHRQEIEKIVVKQGARDSLLGLIFGFTIGITGLVLGSICVYSGQSWGAAIAGASLASLAGVFVYGTRARSKEREAKRQLDMSLIKRGQQ